MRLYRDVAPEQVQQLIAHAVESVARSPAEVLLPACAAVVPEEWRTSLFTLAVELVFVDGRTAEREEHFVDALQAALVVDDETAKKIVEVLLIKSRG